MLNRLFFTKIDNSPLLIFRVFFGILVSCEGFGAILTGWVRRTFIEPQFTFSFIGFEWLQPLPGNGMYIYFILMGVFGIFIALGLKYRLSIISFTLLWTGVYLMQKTSYNNHYYLLMLISIIMCFLPANKAISLDAKRQPEITQNSMYAYVKWVIVFQLFIVYTYAALAKLYAGWLNYSFIEVLFKTKEHYWLIGDLLQQHWLHVFISFMGILFDLLVIPALLWKPTRNIAFGCGIFFHLFNSMVFQIGIFPYLALAFIVFFYEPETIRKIFFKNKPKYDVHDFKIPSYQNVFYLFFVIYFLIQIVLPIRHHFIHDDVLWTEEGHRLSWRMMLRTRSGRVHFKVVNKESGAITKINLNDYLSPKQKYRIAAYPDFIWQFAQRLKQTYKDQGIAVEVYANSRIKINGSKFYTLIDPEVDLAQEPWNHFRHHEWILPSPKELSEKSKETLSN
ncbi:HTTM domain-containing protein [Eudoraea chungangensis]|uniref:HTTM domain-containing protein n=1 Tax=Eudoraea chungangensis TaxID=1481905 RepID=UPI0023EDB46A|nr:HTTM domain-containing protein [Eudoraea chungangensis]